MPYLSIYKPFAVLKLTPVWETLVFIAFHVDIKEGNVFSVISNGLQFVNNLPSTDKDQSLSLKFLLRNFKHTFANSASANPKHLK